MVKAITREEYYNYSCFCSKCNSILLYNNEDIIRKNRIDYIICPKCEERIYV